MKKSKWLFILAVICAVITIICMFLYKPKSRLDLSDALELEKTKSVLKVKYDNGSLSKTEYEKEIEKAEKEYNDQDKLLYHSIFVVGGITAVLLVSGIIVFVVEKKSKG